MNKTAKNLGTSIGKGILVAGGFSAIGAASSALGSSILDSAGADGYSASSPSLQASAIGCAILGGLYALMQTLYDLKFPKSTEDKMNLNYKEFFLKFILGYIVVNGGSMLGWEIMRATGGKTFDMPKQVAATAVGSTIIFLAFCSCALTCVASVKRIQSGLEQAESNASKFEIV